MTPFNPRATFRVDLNDEATYGLAESWMAYFPVREGHRVTQAEQILMYLLADDPLRNGRGETEGLHRIVVSPLVVRYEVYEASLMVKVTSIGFFPV